MMKHICIVLKNQLRMVLMMGVQYTIGTLLC